MPPYILKGAPNNGVKKAFLPCLAANGPQREGPSPRSHAPWEQGKTQSQQHTCDVGMEKHHRFSTETRTGIKVLYWLSGTEYHLLLEMNFSGCFLSVFLIFPFLQSQS